MRRSEINRVLGEAKSFMASHRVNLPPFAHWSPAELMANLERAPTIYLHRLGWDITDFGTGKFEEVGLVLFTSRNGAVEDLAAGKGMVYAEKVMISRARQRTPMHRHIVKTEDIINRGGGKLVLQLHMARVDGTLDREAEVVVPSDAMEKRLPAGGQFCLTPGESITLHSNVWHAFWGEEDVLVGEVSTVNDDLTDNIFFDKVGRFSEIEEDETPMHLLVSDYEKWLKG